MSLDDTASELADTIEEQDPEELPEPASSLVERVQSVLGEDGRSANFAILTGAVSLVRGVRAYRKGRRKRAAFRVLSGLFWIGLALAQRRRNSESSVDHADVADTGPDLDDVETGTEFGGEPATGGEVVDTTPADIDETDTAPELDSDVDAEDVDQSDVAGTDEIDGMESGGETDETTDTEMGAEGVDAERDDSAMEFGDPEMDVGNVERDSGGPEVDVGEVGTHADERAGEDAAEDEDERGDETAD